MIRSLQEYFEYWGVDLRAPVQGAGGSVKTHGPAAEFAPRAGDKSTSFTDSSRAIALFPAQSFSGYMVHLHFQTES